MTDIIFGIDIGTSNTVISYFENNKANILFDGMFKLIPSKIYISSENKIYCGNYIPTGSTDIIHSFKIEIGNDYNVIRNDKTYYIKDILNIFINHIKILILKKFPKLQTIETVDTVITVPSNFSDIQREILRDSFINNNFNILRIINEPSAAALSYGLNQIGEKKIMVIDTGGGTMDITVLEKDDNIFKVIDSVGLNNLGGNNFTNIIMEHIIKKNNTINKSDTLFYTSQRIKEKLSYMTNYSVNLKQYGVDSTYDLTLLEFSKLSSKLLQIIDNMISDLIKSYPDIEHFILVGGSSKMKILQEKIYDITGKKPWIHPNLDSVVSEGACLYGGIIKNIYTSEEKVLLIDILPLSLGVETVDGNFSIIVPKNTPLPAKRTQKYTIDTPGEASVKIKIYQGERKIANKNILIGEIEFDKVSLTGIPVIEISFKVDLNGIIYVFIVDKKSGCEKNILLKDIPKYDNETINKITEDALVNNEIDDETVIKLQRIYTIQTKIENAFINLNINDLLSQDKKLEIQLELNDIEEKINNMSNIELLDTLQHIDTKYIGLTQTNNFMDNDNNIENKMDNMEKVLINEFKSDLIRRINLLLVQNPDWSEYLSPLLEELEINNLSMEYLQEKLNILKELQGDDNNEIPRDFKEELKNMCIYLNIEFQEGQIELESSKKEQMINIIIKYLDNINNNDNNDSDYWCEELNNFNKICEELYLS